MRTVVPAPGALDTTNVPPAERARCSLEARPMLTYLLLGIGEAGAHNEIVEIGGWFGVATSAAGLYGAFASEVNSTLERTVLALIALRRA